MPPALVLLFDRSRIAALVAVLILFAIAYADSLGILAESWGASENGGQKHGYLVLACTLYLIALKREQLGQLIPSFGYWALLPLFGLSILWLAGKLVDVQTVQTAVLPAILLCVTAILLGNKAFKLVLLPLSLLFFALPMWSPLLPYLVDLTTQVTHFNLKLIGRPVFVEDNFLHLAGGSFVVEESCAGLQFLLVTSTLSLMYGSMNGLNLKKTAGLFLIGTMLAFVANWIRVLAVVLIGDYTQMESSLTEDHANFGWMVYLILVLVPLLYVSRFFESSPVALRNSDTSFSYSGGRAPRPLAVATYIAASLVLVSGPLLESVFAFQSGRAELRPAALPTLSPPWRLVEPRAELSDRDWRPHFQNTSEDLAAIYSDGSQSLTLHIAYYASQQQGAELINVRNLLADDVQWSIVPGTTQAVKPVDSKGNLGSAVSFDVQSPRAGRKRIWYWYNVGGQLVSDPYRAKIAQVTSLLEGRTDAAFYAMAIDCEVNCDRVLTNLESFYSSMLRGE